MTPNANELRIEIALLRAQLVGIRDYAEAVEQENRRLIRRLKELDKAEQPG